MKILLWIIDLIFSFTVYPINCYRNWRRYRGTEDGDIAASSFVLGIWGSVMLIVSSANFCVDLITDNDFVALVTRITAMVLYVAGFATNIFLELLMRKLHTGIQSN